MAKGQKNGAAASRIAGMNPFDREILIAKRCYRQLTEHLTDKVSRRRVIGMINDYAMQDDTRALENTAPKEDVRTVESDDEDFGS